MPAIFTGVLDSCFFVKKFSLFRPKGQGGKDPTKCGMGNEEFGMKVNDKKERISEIKRPSGGCLE
jgi:hypothetical protein